METQEMTTWMNLCSGTLKFFLSFKNLSLLHQVMIKLLLLMCLICTSNDLMTVKSKGSHCVLLDIIRPTICLHTTGQFKMNIFQKNNDFAFWFTLMLCLGSKQPWAPKTYLTVYFRLIPDDFWEHNFNITLHEKCYITCNNIGLLESFLIFCSTLL